MSAQQFESCVSPLVHANRLRNCKRRHQLDNNQHQHHQQQRASVINRLRPCLLPSSVSSSKSLVMINVLFIALSLHFVSVSSASPGAVVGEKIVKTFLCEDGIASFELITGSVYSASADTITTIPGTLKLTDCLNECQKNISCQSVNYETGLCILFTSSATTNPAGLQASRFPVFTIYGQKICLPKSVSGLCPAERVWTFERVLGYELRRYSRKNVRADTKLLCMEACLTEREFTCRSFNYDSESKDCTLSEMDRHTLPSGPGSKEAQRSLMPSANGTTDYFESNCVVEPNKLCDFKKTKGKLLKTVDSVHEDVKTETECKERCINAPYRCFSFDLGDPSSPVCRTSHLDRASLSHIEEPYTEVADASTWELYACYNVSILCRAREMVAQVRTSKLFNGKIYAKSKPNSCVNDVSNTLDFEISMPFHDVMCDVKQVDAGSFANDIIIQHHDMIVTTQDLGLSVHCNYDLSNRSISNINLNVEGDMTNREGTEPVIHSSVVGAPNVTMAITDRTGQDIQAAQVGDPLSLRFEILEKNSPYEIMVRELVAVDGSDSSEILLIDSQGCPTDASIMGVVSRVNGNGQLLEAPFDAFKFPASDVVQFRALVTPCVPACEPVTCNLVNPDTGLQKESLSYGRRRRSARSSPLPGKNGSNDDVVVVGAIKITDSMIEYKDGKSGKTARSEATPIGILEERIVTESISSGNCTDFVGLVVTFVVFLIAQLTLIVAWYYVYRIKMQRKLLMSSKTLAAMAHHASSSGGSSSGSIYGGHSGYPSFISSSECLTKSSPNSTLTHHSIHPHHPHSSAINYNGAMYKM